jgi:DNA-binding response OmpR family regulator
MSAKMLAVDNNSDVRHLLKIRLKKAGYQVISAGLKISYQDLDSALSINPKIG